MAYSMLTIFVNGHCNLMLLANGYIYFYIYCECWSISYLVPTMYTNAFYFLHFTLNEALFYCLDSLCVFVKDLFTVYYMHT